jgi:putative inorganic carbon (hco3(-)) transporter
MESLDRHVRAALLMTGWRERAPAYLAGSAAALCIVSIAAYQIVLGAAIVALLASPRRLRWPPVTAPLLMWMGWTLVSLFVNGHVQQGMPQVKKFYVYLILFVVFAGVRTLAQIRWVVLGWITGGTLSAGWSMVQLVRRLQAAEAANQSFYTFYLGQRITGFVDHWMTFGGHMMMALMILGALMLFGRERKWLWATGALLMAGLLAAFTRSMWAGAAVGGLYLLWSRSKWLVAAFPVIAGAILLANPLGIRERALSTIQPHDGQVDSNEHRAVLRRVGWEMIQAHPFFGVGPEQVGPQFLNHLPIDVPQPIPKEWYYNHLHNIYLHFGAERGLPALAALLWMFGQALLDFAQALRTRTIPVEGRWVLHAAIAVILAFLVSGYGEVNFGDSEVLAMFLSVMGCGYALIAQFEAGKRQY